jgi:hypothetical protein
MPEIAQETRRKPGRPLGSLNKRPRSPRSDDAQQCTVIEKLLANHYNGREKLSPTQLKAIELRYARLRPTLAAVEHTQLDPRDQMSPEELVAKLAALFDAQPQLLQQVLALRGHASVTPANDEPAKLIASTA